MEAGVETGVPQGFPVSPVLFTIDLSRVFREEEAEVEGHIVTSFANDCSWLVTSYSIE